MTGLPPEVVAVAFAKTSRSPRPFDEIAAELNEDKSRKFHERWVVGYGHSSVAEHAVLSIAIENVSILATKVLEDNRLASYTEKSSRYQIFDRSRIFKPKKIMDSKFAKLYEDTANMLMDSYFEILEKTIEYLKTKHAKKEDESDKLYGVRIKVLALDNCRCILPAATLTNLGMTINARNLEYAIVKLLTHPLEEMQEIGEEIKTETLKITPTLVQFTDANKYLGETCKEMEKLAAGIKLDKLENHPGAVIVEYDEDAENKLVAALLYRFTEYSYAQVKKHVQLMNAEEKEKMIDEALKRYGDYDRPLRELEHVYYTFDILIDYGIFRDVQRHRMCTQTNQELTISHGYEVPDDIKDAGLQQKFDEVMKKAADCYEQIAKELPKHAAYIVPLAYRKRTLFKMNLRQLYHFIRLRSRETGHRGYIKLAQQMYDLIAEKQPLLAKYIRVTK